MNSLNALFLIISILSAASAQIFLKKGVLALGNLSFSLSGFLNLILNVFKQEWLFWGTVLFIISFLSYLYVLSEFKLSFAQPFTVSCGIVLVSLASKIFLKEDISVYQILGVVLIVFGIFILSYKS